MSMTNAATNILPRTPVLPSVGASFLNCWRLERVMGSGGAGTVFAARSEDGQQAAIKVMHPDAMADDDMPKRFAREAHLLQYIHHPGVPRIFDHGVTSEGLPYLVMEYLQGESLMERLHRQDAPLPLSEVLSIGVQALTTLSVTHRAGVLHRDLKPENVFLTSDGQVKIIDFGAARHESLRGNVMTRKGLLIGTPAFMPREQALCQGSAVDRQSDLYSLAATLFFALTLQYVHPYDESQARFLCTLVTTPARPLNDVDASVPAPIAEVLDRALEMTKTHRWSSASEMKQALLVAARQCGVAIPATLSPTT